MTPVVVRVPLLVAAFLDTAKSRKDALKVLAKLCPNVPDPGVFLDAYYAQTGGQPYES